MLTLYAKNLVSAQGDKIPNRNGTRKGAVSLATTSVGPGGTARTPESASLSEQASNQP